MLMITSDAADAIRTMIESSELPRSAGIRIHTTAESWNGSGPPVAIEPALRPHPGDRVLREDGAKVFVAAAVAPALEDKLLDADLDPGGDVTFELRDQW